MAFEAKNARFTGPCRYMLIAALVPSSMHVAIWNPIVSQGTNEAAGTMKWNDSTTKKQPATPEAMDKCDNFIFRCH